MSAGHRIFVARKRRGLTQHQLAEAIGTDQGTIHKIENDKQSGQKHMASIAEALGVRHEWLTVGEDPPAWYRPDQSRAGVDDYAPEPSAMDRIATAIERLAASIEIIDRRLVEKAARDEARDQYHAETRRVLDQVRAADRRRPPRVSEP